MGKTEPPMWYSCNMTCIDRCFAPYMNTRCAYSPDDMENYLKLTAANRWTQARQQREQRRQEELKTVFHPIVNKQERKPVKVKFEFKYWKETIFITVLAIITLVLFNIVVLR